MKNKISANKFKINDGPNGNFTTEKWNNWNKNFHCVGSIQNEDDREKIRAVELTILIKREKTGRNIETQRLWDNNKSISTCAIRIPEKDNKERMKY